MNQAKSKLSLLRAAWIMNIVKFAGGLSLNLMIPGIVWATQMASIGFAWSVMKSLFVISEPIIPQEA
jgi:hypothetical protein